MDIALRWSARVVRIFFYRYIAPLEQSTLLTSE